jgi:hypothetical protein
VPSVVLSLPAGPHSLKTNSCTSREKRRRFSFLVERVGVLGEALAAIEVEARMPELGAVPSSGDILAGQEEENLLWLV